MEKAKRTQKEIEKDYKKIKEAAHAVTSIKELENATGLTYAMINTTLSKHPIAFKRIKEQLAINKLEAQRQRDLEAKEEAEAAQKAEKESNKQMESISVKRLNADFVGVVIDASITGIEGIRDVLLKICENKAKIILTSITIKELEKLQGLKNAKGSDARHFLASAAEKPDSYESVLIDETYETPDDCIVKFCADNKEKVTLLTSDKTMALKARMYSIEVHYLKQTTHFTNNKSNSKPKTLIPAEVINDRLLISNFNTDTMSICVWSDGVEYNDGVRELKVGDDVYISTKKEWYITFAHYRMTSLNQRNNCELVYYKRLNDNQSIDFLKASYKSFVKDFKYRLNL